MNSEGRVDIEVLSNIRDAGCFEIEYGIESGVDASLNNIGKDITLDQTRKVVEASKNEGLLVHALFMLGFPWEKRKDLEQTVSFAQELVADKYGFSFAVPFKGTRLWAGMDKEKITDWDMTTWTTDVPIVKSEDMAVEELVDFRKQAYQEVYLNRKYLDRMTERIENHPELRQSYEEWLQFLDEMFLVRLEDKINANTPQPALVL